MTKYNIEITEPAENDLIGIGNYIKYELLEPAIALKTIDSISTNILELETMPFRNELVKDERLSIQGIRKSLINNYIIFYTISEKLYTVTIIRILYAKRNWMELL
jgi:addiction module RelE/StbE family toxin